MWCGLRRHWVGAILVVADRAAQAAVKELPDPPPPPKSELEVELIDLPREPLPAAKPEPVAVARPKAPIKPAAAQTPAKAKPVEAKAPEKARRLKSTAEMAAELAEQPDFDMDGNADPLNDTGVRHLAVKVVKKDSALGKLFKRKR